MAIFAAVGATEQTALNQVGAAPNQAIPTVVWAPYSDPLPEGAVATWQEAVSAVQASTAPETSIHIFNPSQDDIYLPPGEWHLNNTTIVGGAYGWDDYDYSFRPYQYLQYIEVDGGEAFGGWPCHIYGCVGLKNIFFRGLNGNGYATYTTSSFTMPNLGATVNVTVDTFQPGFVVGNLLAMDYAGVFSIEAVDSDTNTLTLLNIGWNNNQSPGTSISSGYDVFLDISVFQCRSSDGTDTSFTLDNCDFRFGSYDWGTFHVYENSTLYLRLKNGTAIRWYAFLVNYDGSCVVQSDGSPCWIGNDTFFGDGYLATFPAPGCYVRENQSIASWDQYQSYTTYYPNNQSDWSGSPNQLSVHDALDRLAAACVAAGHTP